MIKSEGLYFRDKTRHCGYFSKVDNNLYYRNFDEERLYCVNKTTYLITDDKCMSHNFSPYKIDGKYIAIAGMDDWKKDPKWRGLSYNDFCVLYKNHFKKEYERGEDFYKEIKHRFDTTPISYFCRGLYLFQSVEGIIWNLKHDNPIITADHNGFNSSLAWKSSEFDSKMCLVKRFNHYYLYVRNNIDIDRRTIQFAKSTDLVNWSDFETIDIGFDRYFDNYYFCEIFSYRKKLFGFFPYYNDFYSSIRFMVSDDGKKWNTITDLFKSLPAVIGEAKRKNRDHICGGIEEGDNDFFFFVHHNYMGYDKDHDVVINKYSISKKYLR